MLKYNSEGMEFQEVLLEGVWIKNGMTPALSNCLVNKKRQKSAGKFLLIKGFFIFFFSFSLQITLDLHIRNRIKLRSESFLARRVAAGLYGASFTVRLHDALYRARFFYLVWLIHILSLSNLVT